MKLRSFTVPTVCLIVASVMGGAPQGALSLRLGFVSLSAASTESEEALQEGSPQELSPTTNRSFLQSACFGCGGRRSPSPPPPPRSSAPSSAPAAAPEAPEASGATASGTSGKQKSTRKSRGSKKGKGKPRLEISEPTDPQLQGDFLAANNLVTLGEYQDSLRRGAVGPPPPETGKTKSGSGIFRFPFRRPSKKGSKKTEGNETEDTGSGESGRVSPPTLRQPHFPLTPTVERRAGFRRSEGGQSDEGSPGIPGGEPSFSSLTSIPFADED
ncbi:hypothetical protein Emed_006989 [Eimeria media]